VPLRGPPAGPRWQAAPAETANNGGAQAAAALNGTARPSLRDRNPCDKPSRPEAATEAAWSRTLFPYALPSRFQFTLNQDMQGDIAASILNRPGTP